MSLASVDENLFMFYCLETFDDNYLSIDARDLKIPLFDASRVVKLWYFKNFNHNLQSKLCKLYVNYIGEFQKIYRNNLEVLIKKLQVM